MKKIFFVFSLLVLLGSVPAFSQSWMLDYDDAIEMAKAEEKPVLILFTGSDWCRPCMMLEEAVYSKDAFKDFAEENLILVKADFPKRPQNQLSDEQSQKNRSLARNFGARGFPTSVLVDDEGHELNRWVGYDRSGVDGYIQKFKQAGNL